MRVGKWWWLLLSQTLLLASPARADIALLLQQPHSTFGAFNPTGHVAVYLSRVCAESPTRLRRCADGEAGVVISRYNRVAGYDWVAIPLLPYLYAVEAPEQVPESADREGVDALRDAYRRAHLRELAPDAPDGGPPPGDWTQLVGASYDRKIYGFVVETGEASDDALIAHLNGRANERRFNLLLRNCADFAKDVVNFYYPKTVRRSIVADLGITTPKQAARSLVKFGARRPELRSSSFVIPQVPGELKRSNAVRGVTETLILTKKYAAPIIAISPWAAASGLAMYVTTGRFDPEKHAEAVLRPEELAECVPVVHAPSACGWRRSDGAELAAGPASTLDAAIPAIPEAPPGAPDEAPAPVASLR
ncbi:MAG: hypothetical protein LBT74_03520 [Acidobacteriota bacterium]|jgi:hypothetical protein|nr:hypothetical protein [Acidobacteriota bacterium]